MLETYWLYGWQCQSTEWLVQPPILSRLKYLNHYCIDCHKILYEYSWCPEGTSLCGTDEPVKFHLVVSAG